jgi:hypothetical protein
VKGRPRRWWLRVAGCVTLACFCSCVATIHRVDAPNISAEIVGSDRDTLKVLGDDGMIYRIPAGSIRSIDHPGGGMAVTGAILAAVGGLVMVTPDDPNQNRGANANLITGGIYAAAGFVLLLSGLIPYARSNRAAHRLLLGERELAPRPPAAIDRNWSAPITPVEPMPSTAPAAVPSDESALPAEPSPAPPVSALPAEPSPAPPVSAPPPPAPPPAAASPAPPASPSSPPAPASPPPERPPSPARPASPAPEPPSPPRPPAPPVRDKPPVFKPAPPAAPLTGPGG